MKISKALSKLPTIDYRSLKELQGNLKDLTEKNYAKLLKSFTEFGFFVPLFVWKGGEDFYIEDGHQRNRVLTKENITPYQLPYIEIEAENKQEAKKKLLAISSQYGTITQEGWDEFTFDLNEDWLKETVQFDALPRWDMPEATEDDYVPPENIKTDIKRGDLFQIGEHRLMCADATSSEDVQKLLDGNCPILMVTDPPYNIDFASQRSNYKQKYPDNKTQKEYLEFCQSFFSFAPKKSIITCGKQNLSLWLNNFLVNDIGCWIAKNKMAGSHIANLNLWEPILFFGKFDRHKRANDLFEFNTSFQEDADAHPCPKQIPFFADLISNYTLENESVYDPFVGSGTTLVAGQQLGRKCYAMEISPEYVQVCIDRMAKSFPDIEIKRNGKEYKTEQ